MPKEITKLDFFAAHALAALIINPKLNINPEHTPKWFIEEIKKDPSYINIAFIYAKLMVEKSNQIQGDKNGK